ncbi:MAG: FAD:protein FMN transferase [Gammaproteobacteria bacterium]
MQTAAPLTRRRCMAGAGLLVLSAYLAPASARPGTVRVSRPLLGTRVDIVAQGQLASRAADLAMAEMARLERLMTRYRPDSEVAALQRAAGRHPVPVSPETQAVLLQALALSRESGGRFDVTIGAYDGWSFEPGRPRLPSHQERQQQAAFVDHRLLQIDPAAGQAQLMRPGMKLDLGGVAKLPILAAGMRVLRDHGLEGAMVNGGGDVLVTGQLDGRDWRIGLRDPVNPAGLLGTVALRDGVVASSGDYERSFVSNGRRYHHVLDPETGLPAQGVRGVAMVSSDVASVNGRGAMAMLMGPDAARPMLSGLHGVDSVLVDGQGKHWHSSPAMAQRLVAQASAA